MFNKKNKTFLIVFCLIFVYSCSAKDKKLYDISINSVSLKVEIADTPGKRQIGLMNRESLPENQGMLFVFEKEQKMSFWMKDTQIPLSIAYINKSGIIKEIHKLDALSLKAVNSTHSVLYALEVNQGFFEKNGIGVGDQIHFSF